MKKLVLLRHGESTWNAENRFTGWTDVDLFEKGIKEAETAARLLNKEGFFFDNAYTSVLKQRYGRCGLSLIKWICYGYQYTVRGD